MKRELEELRETTRAIYRAWVGLLPGMPVPDTFVRDYLYPDGSAIVRMFLPVASEGAAAPEPDSYLFGLSQVKVRDKDQKLRNGWEFFRPGTWFEGSMLFEPEDGKAYKPRNRGMQQIQSFGTRKPQELFYTMRNLIWPKLRDAGYHYPIAYLIRAGRTVDDSKPFKKKDPPISKKRFK
jgi:hypothetical protein